MITYTITSEIDFNDLLQTPPASSTPISKAKIDDVTA